VYFFFFIIIILQLIIIIRNSSSSMISQTFYFLFYIFIVYLTIIYYIIHHLYLLYIYLFNIIDTYHTYHYLNMKYLDNSIILGPNLGSGGNGVVYKVSFNRVDVAIKFRYSFDIKNKNILNKKIKKELLEEAKMFKILKHEHIMQF